ncbi:5'/3'-nucleotidase SurE [Amycolatopsis sp. GM8]|uniref:5'/3'-nucleotidase SurE n=1 Tax=Amycolatopsis sp. GM8 TaxID=2896530 RepID=UPI001F1B3EE7|nr:5'/3'-nucleotidase SurE [Amycolatopsis sp. GM8]
MRVLITNDDGYRAPGLRALAETVRVLGWDATVVAPSEQMSGASQSRRSGVPAEWAWTEPIAGIPAIHVRSTPAGCVVFALTSGVLPPPDLCLSGVNAGENLGGSLMVSGTYGAVLEAACRGVPGIAVSREFGGPWSEPGTWDWSWVSEAAARTLPPLLAAPSGWFTANVNLSGTDRGTDPAYTRVSRALYYTDTYDAALGRISTVIGYRPEELSPDDDIYAFGEQKRSSITLFPRAHAT